MNRRLNFHSLFDFEITNNYQKNNKSSILLCFAILICNNYMPSVYSSLSALGGKLFSSIYSFFCGYIWPVKYMFGAIFVI